MRKWIEILANLWILAFALILLIIMIDCYDTDYRFSFRFNDLGEYWVELILTFFCIVIIIIKIIGELKHD